LATRGEVYLFFFSRKAEGIITLYSPRARLNEYQSQVNSYLVTQVRCLK
jgi:hypothetical protein